MWGATGVIVAGVFHKSFQSTHPVWGATLCLLDFCGNLSISIHAPRVGCDQAYERFRLGLTISIHAPRVGCDAASKAYSTTKKNFNPRTPCGVRPLLISGTVYLLDFNPRTPCGVRRRFCHLLTISHSISIHAPRVGCDRSSPQPFLINRISIHAPRVGCDPYVQRVLHAVFEFQSTHPVWGATDNDVFVTLTYKFQSTHPVWGATIVKHYHFPDISISIHAPRVGCDRKRN